MGNELKVSVIAPFGDKRRPVSPGVWFYSEKQNPGRRIRIAPGKSLGENSKVHLRVFKLCFGSRGRYLSHWTRLVYISLKICKSPFFEVLTSKIIVYVSSL